MTAPVIRNSSTLSTYASPSSTTLPQPLASSYIVVWTFCFAQQTTVLTDSAGNTYTAKRQKQDANGNWVNLFTAPVTATGTGTLTISNPGAQSNSMMAIEVTGNVSSTPDDGISDGAFSGSAGGTLSISPGITTTVATDLIISAAFDQNNATLTVNTGTLVTSGSGSGDFAIVQQRTTSSTGTYTEAFTVPTSASETAAIIAIAIKGTAGGGGTTLALTGSSVTGSAGTTQSSSTVALTGRSVALSQGTLTPSTGSDVVLGLTGTGTTYSFGTILPVGGSLPDTDINFASKRARPGRGPYSVGKFYRPSLDVLSSAVQAIVLTGQTSTFTSGAVSSAYAAGLAGRIYNTFQNNTSATVTYALAGQSTAVQQGTVTAATGVTIALSGSVSTFSTGTVVNAPSSALTGQLVPSKLGSLGLNAVVRALTGNSYGFAQGFTSSIAPVSSYRPAALSPRLRRPGVSSGTPVLPSAIKLGTNVTYENYYSGVDVYADRMRPGLLVSGTVSSLGYPTGVNSVVYYLIYANDYVTWQYHPGKYVATWTPNGNTVTLGGQGVTNVVSSTGRCEITLPPMPADNTFTDGDITSPQFVWLAAIVGAGAATPDLKVFHSSDEQRINNGNTYTQQFVTRMQTSSLGPVRPMQFTTVESTWVKDATDLPPVGKIGKTVSNYAKTGYPVTSTGIADAFCPTPEDLGRMALECDRDIHINLWPMMTDACMATYWTRFKVGAGTWNKKVTVEGTNEFWNTQYYGNAAYLAAQYGHDYSTGFNYGVGLAGAPPADTDTSAQGKNAGHLSLRCWKAAETAFGRSRVIRGISNQAFFYGGQTKNAYNYVDPGIITAGQKVGTLMDASMLASYFEMQPDLLPSNSYAGHSINTARGITNLSWFNGGGVSNRDIVRYKVYEDNAFTGGTSSGYLKNAFLNGIDMSFEYFTATRNQMITDGFTNKLSYAYEGLWISDYLYLAAARSSNQGPNAGKPDPSGLCMTYNSVTGDFTPADGTPSGFLACTDSAENVSDWFADGDIVRFAYNNSIGFVNNDFYACKIVSGKLRLYTTDANYASSTRLTGGTSGTTLVCNVTRIDAASSKMLDLMQNQAEGQALLEYAYQKSVAFGLTTVIQYAPIGAHFRVHRSSVTSTGPFATRMHGYWNTPTAADTYSINR